ncbi:MAG: putative Ig domain-containing protein, partial [Candidatus Thermoplasmatota archaeon]|nr:putative Ig domain-containing protein [Candidatus Thermoplasmatota archaeon]
VDAQHSRLLGVYGNTVYFAKYGALLAYNVENQTAASQIIPGATSSYLNGAPVLFGSTFAMAHHCGDGSSNTCPNGQRNTLLQWAPEYVTVSDAWNLTPGQRIDGPITGGNGIHFDSGVAVQSMTASAAGAELLVGQAMADITFEYIGLTTYGNYSTWEATNINSPAMSMPGANMQTLVGDTIYFDASDQTAGTELWAYDTSNHSEWRVADINSGSGASFPGVLMELLVGDTLYFSADDGTTGRELWAYNTSNSSVPWQVADINSGGGHSDPGKHLSMVIDDVLYFSANDGSTGGELYAYNTSNGSDPWLVDDLFSGGTGSSPGNFMQVLVDDTIYFDARGGNSNGIELWAYNTSDHSTQRVTDINSGTGHSRPGAFFSTLVDDTIYFSATDGTTGVELWAYDTSNHSTWRVADFNSGSQDSKPGEHLNLLVGDTIYFSADDGSTDVELWAHDTSNHSTWRVADICSVGSCNLAPAYGRPDGSAPGYNMQVLVGDTFYFDAFTSSTGVELWAHDTSNDSTWNAAEMTSGTGSGISAVSFNMLQIAVGDTLYFSAQDGSNSMELWAHRGAEFTPSPTNVNGASSCSSSPSLPLGLSIDSSTCTISGTPTSPSTNQTYTITAVMNGVTYQTTVWLSSAYLPLTPSVEGAHLILDEAMTNITFQYNASAASGSGSGSGGGGSVTSSLAAQNIAGGRYHTCAIVDNGSVACWGGNSDGQLGDGTTNSRSTPTLTDSLGVGRTAVQVATGDYFTCVMLDNDEVKCWGDNQYGQLGDGTTTDKTSPPSSAITFPTGLTPVALVAGDEQACAIMDDESLTCWGRNEFGELGDGTTTDRTSPTAVSLNAGENVIDVGSGDEYTCALLDDGSIKCWGDNDFGQLGDGTTT